jgi:ribosomal protein S18 acetylase RimI-like enzyme
MMLQHSTQAEPGATRVRAAVAADMEQLVEMSRLLHAEGSYRDIPIYEPKLRAFLAHVMTDAGHACFVYEDRSGRLLGFMAGYIAAHFFSLEKGAYDLFVFVRPERRGSLIAYRLWSAFRAFAQRSNARTLCFATVAGIAPERTRKFYTGLGMTEVGSIYLETLSVTAATR